MDILFMYVKVFLVGGFICMLGQILIIKTKITSARILVTFVMLGQILEAFGLYQYLIDFGGAGALVPITGFGRSLAKGAIEGVENFGLMGIFNGGLIATSMGITVAVLFAFIFGLIFSSKSKNLK